MQSFSSAVPTLLIALGGAGTSVLERTKQLYSDMEPKVRVPAGFLSVDVDHGRRFGYHSEILDSSERLILPAQRGRGILPRLGVPPHGSRHPWQDVLDWLPIDAPELHHGVEPTGAAQIRILGRLNFLLHHGEYEQAVRMAVDRLFDQACQGVRESTRIVVVSSACGGFGSGAILDALSIARRLVPQSHVYLHLILPKVFEEIDRGQRLLGNTHLCVEELLYLRRHSKSVYIDPRGRPSLNDDLVADVFSRLFVHEGDIGSGEGPGFSDKFRRTTQGLVQAIGCQLHVEIQDEILHSVDNVTRPGSRGLRSWADEEYVSWATAQSLELLPADSDDVVRQAAGEILAHLRDEEFRDALKEDESSRPSETVPTAWEAVYQDWRDQVDVRIRAIVDKHLDSRNEALKTFKKVRRGWWRRLFGKKGEPARQGEIDEAERTWTAWSNWIEGADGEPVDEKGLLKLLLGDVDTIEPRLREEAQDFLDRDLALSQDLAGWLETQQENIAEEPTKASGVLRELVEGIRDEWTQLENHSDRSKPRGWARIRKYLSGKGEDDESVENSGRSSNPTDIYLDLRMANFLVELLSSERCKTWLCETLGHRADAELCNVAQRRGSAVFSMLEDLQPRLPLNRAAEHGQAAPICGLKDRLRELLKERPSLVEDLEAELARGTVGSKRQERRVLELLEQNWVRSGLLETVKWVLVEPEDETQRKTLLSGVVDRCRARSLVEHVPSDSRLVFRYVFLPRGISWSGGGDRELREALAEAMGNAVVPHQFVEVETDRIWMYYENLLHPRTNAPILAACQKAYENVESAWRPIYHVDRTIMRDSDFSCHVSDDGSQPTPPGGAEIESADSSEDRFH